MVRNYKSKTLRGEIDENAMERAITDVLRGEETPTSAGRKYHIKRQTIESRIKKQDPLKDKNADRTTNTIIYQSKYTAKQVFTKEEEIELVNYIKKCASFQFGLSYNMFRKLAYEYGSINGKAFPEKWSLTQQAGADWLYAFMKRNPSLTLRKPEKTSLARLTGFTQNAVDKFYENLKSLYLAHSFQPKDIYNLDETGITTVLDSPKIIAEKGQRQVGQAVSAERGSLVTLVGIISASGNRLPPIYVFPRLRYSNHFLNECIPGSLGLISKSGWMMSELFKDVLTHIQNNTNCSKERPILLLLDNHSSHCSIESINYSRENGIYLLTFPPHTSHRLQPLDVSVYGPFKKFLQTSFTDFLTNNPGKRITIYEIARLSNLPFQKAFKSENIISGFLATGIYPFNSQTFNEHEFAPENQSDREAAIVNAVQLLPDDTTSEPSAKTPEQIRPISRLNASQKTANSGSSRILTSSIEKKKEEEKQSRINSKLVKKNLKFLEKEKTRNAPKPRKTKNSYDIENSQHKKPQKCKVLVRKEISSSDESEIGMTFADTDQSVGSFLEDDDMSEDNEFSKYKLTDGVDLNVGDYVLVMLAQNCKTPIYYVAEIIESLGNCTFTVSFLRKLAAAKPTFVKPEIKDISLALRSEIELKLPRPSNPASTSRSRTKLTFEVDLSSFYIK